jgi:hypothetical protein
VTEVRWQANRHLWFQADYGIFYAGRFLKETQPGRNLNYWALWANLLRVDRRRDAPIDDLHLAASGLICDRRYLGFDFLAAVKTDSDAGAYAVIHILYALILAVTSV